MPYVGTYLASNGKLNHALVTMKIKDRARAAAKKSSNPQLRQLQSSSTPEIFPFNTDFASII